MLKVFIVKGNFSQADKIQFNPVGKPLLNSQPWLRSSAMSEKLTSVQQLSVGEVSRRSGVPVSTLHFYESKVFLNPRGPTEISGSTAVGC
ncbi:hypothetical protein LMG27177_03980 [Paraburkholderia fynbosensis]|uniref:HTH merR-type domain-containing protein n=1 Tax=Paraburkholderia fynbosensis TaxID=1200993 RepID=A0A6J5G8N2_9BURK|nr:hypothetical protein LMG27177_03980 [Paraburkholderia fynbosensis]